MATSTPTRRSFTSPASLRSNGSTEPPGDRSRTFAGDTRRRVKVPELAAGLLLVVAFGIGAVVWQLRSTDRVPVVLVAATVDRGETITAGDLRVAYVGASDGVARLDPTEAGTVAGQVALVDLRPGMVVTPELVTGEVGLDDGAGIVGLALDGGQYPTAGLAPGDRVNVVVGPADGSAGEEPQVVSERAEVFAVERLDDGHLLVSVKTDEGDANGVASITDAERIRLVQVPR